MNYAKSIDEVEEITGLDFYSNLYNKKTEEKIESNYDPSLWPLSEKRFELRVKKWNKQ